MTSDCCFVLEEKKIKPPCQRHTPTPPHSTAHLSTLLPVESTSAIRTVARRRPPPPRKPTSTAPVGVLRCRFLPIIDYHHGQPWSSRLPISPCGIGRLAAEIYSCHRYTALPPRARRRRRPARASLQLLIAYHGGTFCPSTTNPKWCHRVLLLSSPPFAFCHAVFRLVTKSIDFRLPSLVASPWSYASIACKNIE